MSWIICLLLTAAIWIILPRRRSSIRHLPSPSGAECIWGHEKAVFMQQPGQAFRHWASTLGRTFRIKAAFGAPDILILGDPEGIAHILQKKIYDYHHSGVVRPRVARLLGKGLGWVEGEFEHKRMRKLVSPALSHDGIRSISNEVQDAASNVLNDLSSQVQSEPDGIRVNVVEWTGRATLNVIGRVAFLHDFKAGNGEDARQILDGRKRGSSFVAKYTGFVTLMLLRRFPILNSMPISAIQGQGLAKAVIQSGVAKQLLERNKTVVGADEKERKDLLSRLSEAEGHISHQELFEQISTFIISGHETTTQTLAFTIWELSRHQDIQCRLRSEIEHFTGEPTYDDFLLHFPYLDAVLKETLRLYPGLPYMERVATQPDTVPLRFPVKGDNGNLSYSLQVDPGQTVVIPIIAIHRCDSVWKDPDEFRPERWLEEMPPRDILCSGWANTLAFSDGPRNCIGMRLATYQYKVILSSLIARFTFEDTNESVSLKIASSLQAWVVGKEREGPQLPVHIRML